MPLAFNWQIFLSLVKIFISHAELASQKRNIWSIYSPISNFFTTVHPLFVRKSKSVPFPQVSKKRNCHDPMENTIFTLSIFPHTDPTLFDMTGNYCTNFPSKCYNTISLVFLFVFHLQVRGDGFWPPNACKIDEICLGWEKSV